MKKWDAKFLVQKIIRSLGHQPGTTQIDASQFPNRNKIIEILGNFFLILFPGYFSRHEVKKISLSFYIGQKIDEIYGILTKQIERALIIEAREGKKSERGLNGRAERVTEILLNKIPRIREYLETDIEAAFDGDPAAKSIDEVIISYPYIFCITVHRIAHELYLESIPFIPRIMSEHAHSITGIDIHPGAMIGKYFFIDHGTGVVIGETTVIGNHVKLYQGVTLGALSFPKDKSGSIIRGKKRHPTINDEVTIYAGATILGEKAIVGRGATIGGNVWLIRPVPAYTTVVNAKNELIFNKNKK